MLAVISEFFTEFAIVLGAQTLATAVLAYLAKSILSTWLTKAVEDHKAKLTAEVESFKSRLKLEGDMVLVRYGQLASERFTALKTIYRGLLELDRRIMHSAYAPLISTPNTESDPKELLRRLDELNIEFEYNRIYIPEELVVLIKSFLDETWGFGISAQTGVTLAASGSDVGQLIERLKSSRDKAITPLLRSIETECRKCLQ
jgi:hypothetical protein